MGAERAQWCGMTYLEVLNTPPQGDAAFILMHQWIAAFLNKKNGSCHDITLHDNLVRGWKLASDCEISPAERDEAIALADALAAYNEGVTGPGHCE